MSDSITICPFSWWLQNCAERNMFVAHTS